MPIATITTSNTLNQWRPIINSIIAQVNATGEANNISISGGSINGTQIGNITPSTGVFTNLTVTSTLILTGTAIQLSDNAISGNKISGGTIDNVLIELSAEPTLTNHAATKNYVDTSITQVSDDSLINSIIFG